MRSLYFPVISLLVLCAAIAANVYTGVLRIMAAQSDAAAFYFASATGLLPISIMAAIRASRVEQ